MKYIKEILVFFLVFSSPIFAAEEAHHHSESPVSHQMYGMYGSYPMNRESSGTSWQPDSSLMEGIHLMKQDATIMIHGFAYGVWDDQGGKRGSSEVFGSNMLMAMARRPLGSGTLGIRSMFSLEPLTAGRNGYPLLFQTGETEDGVEPFIDRQHPHDLFMELAATYSIPVTDESSFFVYFGLPGEPALGPPTFMHRFSGENNPEAPITHHWLDSTHITYGVVTAGYVWKGFKIEASGFNGREPDEFRWDIESPNFDSISTRVTFNPTKDLSFQSSWGRLDSPEQLHPSVDTNRFTNSVIYNKNWKEHNWQTTFAWGINRNKPGKSLHAFLLESAVNLYKTHTVFCRVEDVEKDELFKEDEERHGEVFWVNKMSLGYIYDLPKWQHMQWGVGGLGSIHFISDTLEEFYGKVPLSYMLFVRVKLG